MKLYQDVGIHLPEIMVVACRIFSLPEAPSELFFSKRVTSPLSHESAVGCPRCAGNELMITQYDMLSLLREMVMTCRGKTGLKGPKNPSGVFQLFLSYKT